MSTVVHFENGTRPGGASCSNGPHWTREGLSLIQDFALEVHTRCRFFSDVRLCTDGRSAVRPRHAGCRSWCVPSVALSSRAHTWSDAKSSKPRARRGTQVLTFGHSLCKRPPSQKRWSDSSLQVEDPKASGTPTSLANTCATFTGSATTMTAHSIMVCALSHERRLLASAQTCSLQTCPRREHIRNDTATMVSRYGWYLQP